MVGAFGVSPFGLMRRMMEDLDHLFEGFGGRGFDFGSFATPSGRGSSLWSPAIEAFERGGNFVVRADLPGLSPDDVRIEAADDSLLIEGERRSEIESEEQGGVYRSERTYGRFSRLVPLPDGADAQKAQARFENGVLEITVPIAEERSRRRRIEIQGASGAGGGRQRSAGEPPVH
jgi:HSP20 family protein